MALGTEGVSLTIENPAGETYVAMRDPEEAGRNIGLEIGDALSPRSVIAMRPGRWIVGCFSIQTFTSAEVPVSAYPAAFEVVDPDGNWAAHPGGEHLRRAAAAAHRDRGRGRGAGRSAVGADPPLGA